MRGNWDKRKKSTTFGQSFCLLFVDSAEVSEHGLLWIYRSFVLLGCYRFNDGETMREVDVFNFENACLTNCTLTYKITAPIYVQNTQCTFLWKNSTFLKDDQLWQPVSGENEGFSLAYNQQFRGVEIKVRVNSRTVDLNGRHLCKHVTMKTTEIECNFTRNPAEPSRCQRK